MSVDEPFRHSNFRFFYFIAGWEAKLQLEAPWQRFLTLASCDVRHCWTEIRLDCSGAIFPTTKIFIDVFTVWKCHLVLIKPPLSTEISLAAVASSHSAAFSTSSCFCDNSVETKCFLNVNTGWNTLDWSLPIRTCSIVELKSVYTVVNAFFQQLKSSVMFSLCEKISSSPGACQYGCAALFARVNKQQWCMLFFHIQTRQMLAEHSVGFWRDRLIL